MNRKDLLDMGIKNLILVLDDRDYRLDALECFPRDKTLQFSCKHTLLGAGMKRTISQKSEISIGKFLITKKEIPSSEKKDDFSKKIPLGEEIWVLRVGSFRLTGTYEDLEKIQKEILSFFDSSQKNSVASLKS